MTSAPITVVKSDHTGREVWRYDGHTLERDATRLVLEARFNRDDIDLGYVKFRWGDRFVEYFYADRWYNVFAIHDVEDDHLKGYYCNITRPAVLGDGVVRADDLALDVFVFPDGRTQVMDEEEYAALPLTLDERQHALAAVTELQRRARNAEPPFDALSPV
jgi:hypothetical protein